MSNSNLFLQAFSGDEGSGDSDLTIGKPGTFGEREKAFLVAFGQDPAKEMPKPHTGQNWRVDNIKSKKLSFGELMQLQELASISYRDLPAWVIDGGYAVPSAGE